MNQVRIIAGMNVAEFRSFKRALALLLRNNVDYDTAVALLCKAADDRRAWHLDRKSA